MTLPRATVRGVVLAALLPALTFAQDPDPSALKRLSLAELGDVRVTSVSKVPEAVWDTPAAVFVLTRADIARSGVSTVPDALRLVPGVEVARIDTSRNWVVGIRGFGDQFSKGVLLLIDGRSAYTPLWAGVHWPIQDTLLEDVERIEVIRGPGGAIWGANAMNGVINIITRSARETHGTYVSAAAGNMDRIIAGARHGGRYKALDYRFYVKGSSREPQFHSDGREFDTWAMGQVGFRLDWGAGRDQFIVTGDAYTAELGESVRVHTFNPPSSFLDDDPVDLRGVNVLARWQRQVRAGSAVRVQAYVDHTYRLGADFGERRTTFDVDALHQWRPTPRHEIVWGAGGRTSPSRMTQTYAFSNFIPQDHTLNNLSAFAQDTISLVPRRLALTAGVKLKHNSYTGLDVQPSARIRWTPNTHQTLWGGITRAVRTPSRVDQDIEVSLLAGTTPLIYAVIAGNPDFEPESVVGIEAGYRTLFTPSFYFDLAVFRNRYDGLLDLGSPTTGPRTIEGVTHTAFVFPWINGNDGTTHGFELTPDWQISEAWRLRGSYSYLNVDLEARPENLRRQFLPILEGSTPTHHLSVQSLLALPNGIQVDPVYRYVSRRRALDIPAYHEADLRIGIPLTRGFELSVVGQNLLHARHPEWARDPGPTVEIRRSAYVRLTWRADPAFALRASARQAAFALRASARQGLRASRFGEAGPVRASRFGEAGRVRASRSGEAGPGFALRASARQARFALRASARQARFALRASARHALASRTTSATTTIGSWSIQAPRSSSQTAALALHCRFCPAL
jgi:iron complex outermembrane recepter protein